MEIFSYFFKIFFCPIGEFGRLAVHETHPRIHPRKIVPAEGMAQPLTLAGMEILSFIGKRIKNK